MKLPIHPNQYRKTHVDLLLVKVVVVIVVVVVAAVDESILWVI